MADRRVKRQFLLALVAMALVAALPSVADAQYQTSCGFIVDPPIIETGPDAEVHIVGGGFVPGGTAVFYIDGVLLGTADVADDPDGNVEVTFPLPAQFQTDGEFEITVECPDGATASNVIIVGRGIATTTTAALPVTGSGSTLDFLRLGGLLVAAGVLMLVAARRRARALVHG